MRNKKISLVLLFLLILLTPFFASHETLAAKCGNTDTIILECKGEAGESIFELVKLIVNILSIGVGIVAVIGISITGIQYITAGGNEQTTTKAKRRFFEIIVGITVYATAFLLLNWLYITPNNEHFSSQSNVNTSQSGTTSHTQPNNNNSTTPTNNNQTSTNSGNGNNNGSGSNTAPNNSNGSSSSNNSNGSSSSNNSNGSSSSNNSNGSSSSNNSNGSSSGNNSNGSNSPNRQRYMGVPLAHYSSLRDITANMIVERAEIIMKYAQTHGWTYCDSHGVPPGSDKCISCDRLASIDLYTLGFTHQPAGGYTIGNMFPWLRRLGFRESHSLSSIKRGSIVWLKYTGGTNGGHVFIVSEWNRVTGRFVRYDAGRNWNHKQPIVTNGFPYNIVDNNYNAYLKVFNLP